MQRQVEFMIRNKEEAVAVGNDEQAAKKTEEEVVEANPPQQGPADQGPKTNKTSEQECARHRCDTQPEKSTSA
jgi:hypothetical protein